MQHIINPHINGNLLVFLSLETCLTGITPGLDAGWPFVLGVLLSQAVQVSGRLPLCRPAEQGLIKQLL